MDIGAHVSVGKGLSQAVEYAASVGCESMQIFAKSPRQWHGPPLDSASAVRFADERVAAGIRRTFTHSAYLINLASADDRIWGLSVQALADEISRARALRADGVVTHLGAHPDGESPAATGRIADAITRAFTLAHGPADPRTRLLLENTAGAGSLYGASIAAIGAVIDACPGHRESLGVCFDTCHGHASGIEVTCDAAWDRLLSDIERECGPGALGLIHANDCLHPFASRRDRHAWVGDGTIGIEGFAAMTRQPSLQGLAVITEAPGEVPVKDAENIRRLVSLRDADHAVV
ncbi:MAG TPA: deoxyribonuclease IV [Coriobacteriia bacterium]|nr:deoxyribonuclease IV [Coriobacteriia bacterium]